MKINSIGNYNYPSFKGIVSKEFLISMKKEVDDYAKKGDLDTVNRLSYLYDEVEKKTKDFNIEIYPPKKIKSRDGEKKIIPNKTVVYLDSIDAPILFKAGKNAGKKLAGSVIWETEVSLPCEPLRTADGWETRVGYLTENGKYPPSKAILERILFWSEYAQNDLDALILQGGKNNQKKSKMSLTDKLSEAIKKL